MPSESDHQMDAWLRAYARKRREQAGEPLEMDPATRRLLQAEVARQYGRAQREVRPWWNRLGLLWPRLGFALGLVVVLGLVLAVLFRPQSPPEQMAKSMEEPQPTQASGSLGKDKWAHSVDTPELLSTLKEPATKPLAENEQERALPLRSNAVASPSVDTDMAMSLDLVQMQPSAPATAQLNSSEAILETGAAKAPSGVVYSIASADRSLQVPSNSMLGPVVQPPAGRSFLYRTAVPATQIQSMLTLAPSTSPTGAGPVPKPEAEIAPKRTSTTFSYRFRRNEASRSVGAELATASIPDVLVRFELEQVGTGIRIRDADGSVYEGTWLPAAKPAPRPLPEQPSAVLSSGMKGEELQPKVTSSFQFRPEQPARAGTDESTSFSFRVSGISRSVKQRLTFTGLAQFKPQELLPSRPSEETQARPPGTWLLRGTLQLNGTNAWQIQAAQETR